MLLSVDFIRVKKEKKSYNRKAVCELVESDVGDLGVCQ